ncbi:MAG TPA: hypothetical protein VJ396_03015 [Acidiferrobacterales bacterium]|nr:hypothetical protein [Acidiferrobacterales bacterium]
MDPLTESEINAPRPLSALDGLPVPANPWPGKVTRHASGSARRCRHS